ncbi:MAG: MgtC/SapB family protein [Polyangiales bacterium]
MNWSGPLAPGFCLRLAIAVVCGTAIGLERQLRGKPSGMRTSILVCVGTMTFVQLGARVQGGDPARVLSQVVTGIGFLGAGLMFTRHGSVKGVTSAAVIWTLAGIGAAIGLDLYGDAIALTAVVILVLVGVQRLENTFVSLRRGVHSHTPHWLRGSGVPPEPQVESDDDDADDDGEG